MESSKGMRVFTINTMGFPIRLLIAVSLIIVLVHGWIFLVNDGVVNPCETVVSLKHVLIDAPEDAVQSNIPVLSCYSIAMTGFDASEKSKPALTCKDIRHQRPKEIHDLNFNDDFIAWHARMKKLSCPIIPGLE